MWQQKLSASGVAIFHWQEDEDLAEPESANVPERRASIVHNPALAAIRASQQLQDFVSKGGMNGSDVHATGVQASIQAFRDLAVEQDRKFQQENNNGSESSTPENSWPTTSQTNGHTLKRRISELSDSESQLRSRLPPPSTSTSTNPDTFYSSYPPTTASPLDHHHNDVNVDVDVDVDVDNSPPPAKRRPDPNEDTIGSDLDDTEDEGDINSDEEDENMPIMLCLYDKVHRTKNKWRANMNHGVICINGREWVFEKANGEYEW